MISMKELSLDKDEFKEQLRFRLIYERKKAKLTLEEVAQMVNLTDGQVQNHELGVSNVYSYHVANYARVYNKPVSYFYGDEDNAAIIDLAQDKRNLLIAAEIVELRDDIKITVFNLAKQINKSFKKQEKKEQAA